MSRLVVLRRWEQVAILLAVALRSRSLALDIANHGLVAQLDDRVRDMVQPRRHGHAVVDGVSGGLGELWVATPLFVIAGLVVAQLTWQWWPLVLAVGQLRRGRARHPRAQGCWSVAKVRVRRPSGSAIPGYFPSGHTATSAVCFGVIVYLLMCAREPLGRAAASRVHSSAAARWCSARSRHGGRSSATSIGSRTARRAAARLRRTRRRVRGLPDVLRAPACSCRRCGRVGSPVRATRRPTCEGTAEVANAGLVREGVVHAPTSVAHARRRSGRDW